MRVHEAFQADAACGLITLAGYLPGGYPSDAEYLSAVGRLAAAGFRILEIGVPCPDAGLDGMIIREACDSLVRSGVGIERALQLGGDAAAKHGMAGVGMLYSSALERTGHMACLDLFLKNGIHSILVPDLPGTAWERFAREASSRDVDPIGFAPPDADESRVAHIVAFARGFLYIPSYAGTTGNEFGFDESLPLRFTGVKIAAAGSSLPLVVGFGIRRASDVEAVRILGAHGAVVGTALVQAAGKGPQAVEDVARRIAAGRGAGAWKA